MYEKTRNGVASELVGEVVAGALVEAAGAVDEVAVDVDPPLLSVRCSCSC